VLESYFTRDSNVIILQQLLLSYFHFYAW